MKTTNQQETRLHEQAIIIERLASSRSIKEVSSELNGLTELEQIEVLQKAIYATEDDIEMYLAWEMPALAASKTSLLTFLEDTKVLVQTQYIAVQN